ncbi:MAG TPA: long-chain fatty acid--CoA ligase [Thermomicrobiaceae bacterium]|nr:long-chain fatty acid--CoA ligase [Thermomicrobiaceae bacterium]
MDGLMMDFPLTLPVILDRARTLFGGREVVSRLPDRSLQRATYAEVAERATRLAAALHELGIRPGDRVATLCWNHQQHLEAYLGIPLAGAVLHTLNLRLHPDDLAYIVDHAGDRAIIVDDVLLPLLAQFRERVDVPHVIVVAHDSAVPPGTLDYEGLLAAADVANFQEPSIDERQAAAMCYTSGTTGRPKGVVYPHRALVLHSLAVMTADVVGLSERDSVLPVVPMFHANAWGLPYASVLAGAKQVLPGPHLDPASLLELMQTERVTLAAGVPTIWLGLLQFLEQHPGEYDLSSVARMPIGGQAVPESMIRAYRERHGIQIIQAWGMTETGPIATIGHLAADLDGLDADEEYRYRSLQGRAAALIQVRIRGEEGILPWDGEAMGEVEVRGPWVASAYYENPESAGQFTDDGWLRTGDIASIDRRGYVALKDRAKDVIKSGGEWISSIALENALMGHPAVAEAAVVAAAHPRWLERPVAVVVLKDGQVATEQELREHLAPRFARWWLPDAVVFVDAIPRTSTGKFLKAALRDEYRDLLTARAAAEQAVAGPAADGSGA